jgi:hypothetical protein
MGMTATCPGCGHSEASDNHRGGRLGACPKCGGQMRGATAGKARGRYTCPVTGSLVTLGLGGVQLDQPMRLIATGAIDEFDRTERKYLARSEGLVYGPGCVVDEVLPPGGRSHPWKVALIPAPGSDPAAWVVNERLQYKKCKGCGASVVASDDTRMDHDWTPKRASYSRGRLTRGTAAGPHPAGTYACKECRLGETPLW